MIIILVGYLFPSALWSRGEGVLQNANVSIKIIGLMVLEANYFSIFMLRSMVKPHVKDR